MARKLKKRRGGDALIAQITGDPVTLPGGFSPMKDHKHKTSFTSTRKAVYRGKTIKVRTTYRIEIDDEPLMVHTMVLDDGTVHCHGLPNYAFASALDLARAIIDSSALVRKPDNELGKKAKAYAGGKK